MNPPPYVTVRGATTALCLLSDGKTYYRAAGAWAGTYEERDGRFYFKALCGRLPGLDGEELVACTKEYWVEDNGAHAEIAELLPPDPAIWGVELDQNVYR